MLPENRSLFMHENHTAAVMQTPITCFFASMDLHGGLDSQKETCAVFDLSIPVAVV